MAGKDILMMSRKEIRRLHVIKKVIEGGVKGKEAAECLDISDRQIRRIVNRVREEGEEGIRHRLRGIESKRKISEEIKEKAVKVYREKYDGFGPTLACEKMNEDEGIEVSDETLRKWLIEAGEWKRRSWGKKHRRWRERKDYSGEMVQMDGSHHDWFEGRGERCVLMGYIDDATGRVFGRFYDYEGTISAMESFKRYIKKNGIPQSIYLDKHTTYKSTAKPTIGEELSGSEPLSEFGRALKDLGVKLIHANSPQAKGRVERLFRTLQDRLVKGMGLRGIKNKEEAKQFLDYYLPLYNKSFSHAPQGKENLHRKIPQGTNLDSILCIKNERTLRNDFTIAYNNKLYQIEDNIRAEKVTVEERIAGSMFITYKGKRLKNKEIQKRPISEKTVSEQKARKVSIPSADHPWRKPFLKRYPHNNQSVSMQLTP